MSALAGALLDQLVNSLRNPAPAGNTTEDLSVWIGEVYSELVEVARNQLWLDVQQHGAWLGNEKRARQIGKDLEELAGDQDWMWHRLVEVILPHTEAYLIGYVWSKGIVPLRQQLAKVESSVRFLLGWRGQIDTWRKITVDPDLAKLLAFLRWFDQNARAPVLTLQGWLKRPGTFATWAVPILTDPITVYLATKARRSTVDRLTQLIVDHSPDVWRHVEAATVAILNTEV